MYCFRDTDCFIWKRTAKKKGGGQQILNSFNMNINICNYDIFNLVYLKLSNISNNLVNTNNCNINIS